MKIKIYCNITYITYIAYITSRIALHNKSCMPMDEYSKPNSQIKIKCLNANARMQQQHQSQQQQ